MRFGLMYCVAVMIAFSACSSNECDDDQIRLGSGCRELRDAGAKRDASKVSEPRDANSSEEPRGESAEEHDARAEESAVDSGESNVVDASAEVVPEIDASAQVTSDASHGSTPPQPKCGNGLVEKGETCEPKSTVPCPASCDDGAPCTKDSLVGGESTCDSACKHETARVSLTQADQCCPAGANTTTDKDCEPACGNGAIERGELCDGNCPTEKTCDDGDPCTWDVLNGVGCNVSCTHSAKTGNREDGCCVEGEYWLFDPVCPRNYSCGNSCPSADDPSTPGDDRAGYIRCGAVSCAPGTYCYAPIGTTTTECRAKVDDDEALCDGPEDCPANALCFQDYNYPISTCVGAGENPYQALSSECHRDSDCVPSATGALRCVPNTITKLPWSVSFCRP